jgi:hypothetical protein
MLGKLIKNEYRATARLILPLYIWLVFVTLLNKLIFVIEDDPASVIAKSKVMMAFAGIMMATYVLSLIAVGALTVIFLIKRFYDNMLKDEGYLSFTLPVSTTQHMVSKIVVSYSWLVASFAAIFASINVLFAGQGIMEFWHDLFKELSTVINDGNQVIFVMIIAIILLTIYNAIITPYVCFSVGQRFNGHKVIGAFITYIVIYIINQIIGVVVMVALVTSNAGNLDTMTDGEIMNFTLHFELILLIAECTIFTVITHYMLDKKLNLD